MKNIILIISFLFSVTIFYSCCDDCNQGRITDQLDTLQTLQNVKKDLFYFRLTNGSIYKIKKVKKDSIVTEGESNETSFSSLRGIIPSIASFFISSANASPHPNNDCKTADACVSEEFAGSDRKKAKTSVYKGGTVETFDNISDLLKSLPSDDEMRNHDPKISKACESDRIQEEERYVKIKLVYLYGIYREKDNDFHVIIGNGEWGGNKMKLFNVEISGLPDSEGADYVKLNKVRSKIIKEFGNIACGDGAFKPVDELIPISVEGPLFYDIDHAPGVVGFTSDGIKVKPKTSWEIHPVTNIIFQ